jgi:hypothetical protein
LQVGFKSSWQTRYDFILDPKPAAVLQCFPHLQATALPAAPVVEAVWNFEIDESPNFWLACRFVCGQLELSAQRREVFGKFGFDGGWMR